MTAGIVTQGTAGMLVTVTTENAATATALVAWAGAIVTPQITGRAKGRGMHDPKVDKLSDKGWRLQVICQDCPPAERRFGRSILSLQYLMLSPH